MRRFIPVIAAVLMAPFAALAAGAETDGEPAPSCSAERAAAFVTGLAGRAVPIASRTEWETGERHKAIRDLFQDAFDLDYISRAMLGRFRVEANEDQIDRYRRLFPDYFVALFGDDIIKLVKGSLEIERASALSRPDQFGVLTEIVPGSDGETISVSWQIRCANNGTMQILNFRAQGVSPIQVKRDEFATIAQNEGVAGLLDVIENVAPDPLSRTRDTEDR